MGFLGSAPNDGVLHHPGNTKRPLAGSTSEICLMNTVSLFEPGVNEAPVPIEEVIEWAEGQAAKGDMGGASARIRVTSLRQMAEMVAADERKDARSILENMPRLSDRWARKNLDGKPDTARTYASRARTTIEEYFRWAAAPSNYGPKRHPPRAERKPPAKANAPAPVEKMVSVPQAPAATAPPSSPLGEMRTCPLGQGRDPFRYILPADGLQTKDAMRIAFHLITMADDYDASTMTPVQVMSAAIQRTQ